MTKASPDWTEATIKKIAEEIVDGRLDRFQTRIRILFGGRLGMLRINNQDKSEAVGIEAALTSPEVQDEHTNWEQVRQYMIEDEAESIKERLIKSQIKEV